MRSQENAVHASRTPFSWNWLWILLPICLTLYLMVLIKRAAVTVPFEDELHFNTLYGYMVNGQFPSIRELLATHNGHPYLTLKLIFSAIFMLNLPWKVLMYAQPLFLLWTFFIAARAGSLKPSSWVDAVAYVSLAVCIITPRIWEDLYWGMQLSAQICLAFSLWSFSLITDYTKDNSTKSLVLALIAATAASMSAGAGIVVPPMIVAAAFFSPGKRSPSHLIATGIFLVLSSALTLLCFELSSDPGLGHKPLNIGLATIHAARMLAHLYFDFESESKAAIWLGLFTGITLAYLAIKLIQTWPRHLFAVLCALLGFGLITMITYARVKAGLFQPNASRYVPEVLPLSIGLILLLRSLDMKVLLAFFASAACIGFACSASTEWGTSPYRKMAQNALKTSLCDQYKTADPYNTMNQIRDMHKLFCERRW